jgi:hypothetical protein
MRAPLIVATGVECTISSLPIRFRKYLVRTVAVVSGKGGVGKSTISVHLPACAALHKQRASLRIAALAGVPAAVMLNQVPVRLGACMAYSYATFDGRSVFEYEPARVTAQEAEALYKWTMKHAPASA